MPRFSSPEARARYMVEQGITVDEATAKLIGEPEKKEQVIEVVTSDGNADKQGADDAGDDEGRTGNTG